MRTIYYMPWCEFRRLKFFIHKNIYNLLLLQRNFLKVENVFGNKSISSKWLEYLVSLYG